MTNIQLYIQLKVLVFSKVIVSSKLLITVYLSYFLSNKIFLNLLPETMILAFIQNMNACFLFLWDNVKQRGNGTGKGQAFF